MINKILYILIPKKLEYKANANCSHNSQKVSRSTILHAFFSFTPTLSIIFIRPTLGKIPGLVPLAPISNVLWPGSHNPLLHNFITQTRDNYNPFVQHIDRPQHAAPPMSLQDLLLCLSWSLLFHLSPSLCLCRCWLGLSCQLGFCSCSPITPATHHS